MPPALNIMKDASLNHLYVIRMIKMCIKGSPKGGLRVFPNFLPPTLIAIYLRAYKI